MTRPTVLIASTQPAMAYALGERLKKPCHEVGLRLDICPDGDGEKDLDTVAYSSAESLFDVLEKREPMELADTLVVLDLGAGLEDAFKPEAAKQSVWRPSKQAKAGVAVELLLRFPQVFPVFLSPAVPVETIKVVDGIAMPVDPKTSKKESKKEWTGFHCLRESLCVATQPESKDVEALDVVESLPALYVPLHFVTPLDGGVGLESTLGRFARGMRCWFDPTGLRTLVRNRFLGSLFGSDDNWSNTWPKKGQGNNKRAGGLRQVMLERIDHVAVAIDEEREFAMLSAYAAYKFGRRAWMVTSFGEFCTQPLWNRPGDMVILRDIDMRFPDIPRTLPVERRPGASDTKEATSKYKPDATVRELLQSVYSLPWKKVLQKCRKPLIRVVSSEADVIPLNRVGYFRRKTSQWNKGSTNYQNELRLGERERPHEYLGLRKPLSFLHEYIYLLQQSETSQPNYLGTVLSRLGTVPTNPCNKSTENKSDMPALVSPSAVCEEPQRPNEDAVKVHGAPYLNLAMSESLLHQAARYTGQPMANLMGALLSCEAFQLLLGMSKTTALEALLLHHKKEASAEVEFPGVSHAVEIQKRRQEIECTLDGLITAEKSQASRNMYLSQFWSEMKQVYRQGEQFHAAEEANSRSLVHSRWLPWPSTWQPLNLSEAREHCVLRFKGLLVKCATTLWAWLAAYLVITIVVLISSYLLTAFTFLCVGEEFDYPELSLVLSSVSQSPIATIDKLFKCGGALGRTIMTGYILFSYVMLSVFIAMMFRKITRS